MTHEDRAVALPPRAAGRRSCVLHRARGRAAGTPSWRLTN